MADETPPSAGFDDVLAEMRRRVERRRQAGDYPPGLEDELNRHFEFVQRTHRRVLTHEEIVRAFEAVRSSASFTRDRISTESKLPGGEIMHRTVAKAVGREVEGVLAQLRDFGHPLIGLLEHLVARADDPHHAHPDILGPVHAIEERLARLERVLGSDWGTGAGIEARLAALELRISDRPESSADALPRVAVGPTVEDETVAEHLSEQSPVLVLGFGDGGLLRALTSRGIAAEGVESDVDLYRDALSTGLLAHRGDGLAHLERLPTQSLGGIVVSSSRAIEALPAHGMADLVDVASTRLRPGGKFVVGPHALRLVDADYVQFLVDRAGFTGGCVSTAVGDRPDQRDALLVATR